MNSTYSFSTEEELIDFILSNEELYKKIIDKRKDGKKQSIGEKIYEKVMVIYENDEQKWGKLTGMLIESIDIDELEKIVENEASLLKKIKEANEFYEQHTNLEQHKETTPDISSNLTETNETTETNKNTETKEIEETTEEKTNEDKKIDEEETDDEDDEDDKVLSLHNWDNDDNTISKSWLVESGELTLPDERVEYNSIEIINDEDEDENDDEDYVDEDEENETENKIEEVKIEEKKDEVKEEEVKEIPKKVKKYYVKKDFEYTPEQLKAVKNFKFDVSDKMNQSAFYAVIKPFEGLRIPGGLLNFIFKQACFTSSKNIPASVLYIYLLEKFVEEVVYIIENNYSFNVITFLENSLFYEDENGAEAIKYHSFVNYMIKCPQFIEILNVSKFIEDVEDRNESFSSFYSWKKSCEKIKKEKELKKKSKN